MNFKKVDSRLDLPVEEESILKFWREKDIFKKTLEKDAPAGIFVFFEGPPTANGKPVYIMFWPDRLKISSLVTKR